jgi:hypothetical protein
LHARKDGGIAPLVVGRFWTFWRKEKFFLQSKQMLSLPSNPTILYLVIGFILMASSFGHISPSSGIVTET